MLCIALPTRQKSGMILAVLKLKLQKTILTKKCALKHSLNSYSSLKKNQKDSDDF
jgi:hypothetical protein